LLRIMNRDLRLAGIPKRDERGRTIDVHALRGTFATMLARSGVPMRTAQAVMRHSGPLHLPGRVSLHLPLHQILHQILHQLLTARVKTCP
jgi:integrase